MNKINSDGNGIGCRKAGLLAAATLVLLALGLAACESDDPNGVGMDLVDVEIDALLQTVDVTAVTSYRGIPIADTNVPFHEQQVLYLGEQGGNASSIVVQFDLDAFLESAAEDSLTVDDFAAANLDDSNLRLFILSAFTVADTSLATELEKYPWYTKFEVYKLDAIDPSLYPGGDEPATGGISNLDPDELKTSGSQVFLDLADGDLADWLLEGGVHTFLIREGEGSGEGLVGYASNEMVYGGSTLEDTADVDHVGPVLNFRLVDRDEPFSIPSTMDFSTFHEIGEVPAEPTERFLLRTGLRSYPALYFDLSAIPEDVFINRAILTVVNDTLGSWGTLESMIVSEFDTDLFGAEGDTLDLDELAAAAYPINGMLSLDPNTKQQFGFNVTTSIQRYVNGAYEGTRGFILTPAEDFLTNYDTAALDPEFYFNQFLFYGTSQADSLRPRLEITYAVNEEVQGGGK